VKTLVMATIAVLTQGIAFQAYAASEIDCMVMWDRADVDRNGILDGEEATAYLDAIRKSTKKYGMKNRRPAERSGVHAAAQMTSSRFHFIALSCSEPPATDAHRIVPHRQSFADQG
jgi:hypothetical protein